MYDSMRPTASERQSIADILEKYIPRKIEEAGWREGTKEQKDLADWYDKGGGFLCIALTNESYEEMRQEVRKRGIPCIPFVNGGRERYITFRSCDVKRLEEARDSVLFNRSCFLVRVTGDELMEELNTGKGRREAIFLEGLDKEESVCIRSLCRTMGRGVLIALDRMQDGTFRIGCEAPNAIQLDPLRMDLGKAALAACLALEGSDRRILRLAIRADIRFDRESRMGFPSYGGLGKGPLYITGRNEKARYIRLTKDGFVYGALEKAKDGTGTFFEYSTVGSGSPGYYNALEAAYAKIDSKVVLTKESDLVRHLETNALDPEANKEKRRRSAAISAAEAVDWMIKTNAVFRQTARDDISSKQKISEYRNEAARLLEGIRKKSVPDGYSRENVDFLKEAFAKNGIRTDALMDVTKRLFEIEFVVRSAENYRESIDAVMKRAEEKSKEAAFHAPLGREGNRRDSKEKGGRG